MKIRCPHCRNHIDLVTDTPLDNLDCPSCGSRFSLITDTPTDTFRSAADQSIGHFQLIESLGVGHFGKVWKARDMQLDRTVALKVPRKEQLSESEREQFFREARAAAQLRHPHIVTVHEVGRDRDTIYIASDFVQGVNLQVWLRTQRPSAREAAELCLTIAGALEHAHQQGVVHRDLKPGNIMLDLNRQPHIMDFGLAKRQAGEITMTMDGQVLGTPAYMSPEQARGEGHAADGRTDIYSLGVILYELLTGELPFRGEKQMLIYQILRDEPMPPRRINGRVPRDLETICLRCLEKNARQRYQTAGELAEDLRRYLSGRPVLARPITRAERLWRWGLRNPLLASLGTAVVLLLTIITIVSLIGFLQIRSAYDLARQREHEASVLAGKEKLAREKAVVQTQLATAKEREAREASARERAAANEARELLAGEQLDRGVRQLVDGDQLGLLSLLEACRTAPAESQTARSARLLWAGWHQTTVGRLRWVLGGSNAVAFSPDGRLLASAKLESAQVWDLENGRPHGPALERQRTGGFYNLSRTSIHFSPDGALLALVVAPHSIDVWDTTTFSHLHEFKRSGEIITAGFTSDGQFLTVEFAPSTELQPRRGPRGPVLVHRLQAKNGESHGPPLSLHDSLQVISAEYAGIMLSSDTKWFAAPFSRPGTFGVWDTQSGNQKVVDCGDASEIKQIAISPDGNIVAVSNYITVRSFERATGKPYGPTINLPLAFKLQFSGDGKRLATGSANREVRVWDIASGRVAVAPVRQQNAISDIALHPEIPLLATTSVEDALRVWETVAFTNSRRLPVDQAVQVMAVRPKSHEVAISTAKGVEFWNLDTAESVGEPLRHDRTTTGMRFSASGEMLVTWGSDSLHIWDVANRALRCEVPIPKSTYIAVVFHPDETMLALTVHNERRLIDTRTGETIGNPQVHVPRDLPLRRSQEFGADGTLVFAQGTGNTLQLFDTKSMSPHGAAIVNETLPATFSPDGKMLCTQSTLGSLQLWDTRNMEPICRMDHAGHVMSVVFSPAGDLLAAASFARGPQSDAPQSEVHVWQISKDEKAATEVATIPAPSRMPLANMLFHPEGRQLAIGDFSGRLALWDLARQRFKEVKESGDGGVVPIFYSPDGKLLLVQTSEGTARLWETSAVKPYGDAIHVDQAPPTRLPGVGVEMTSDGTYLLALDEHGVLNYRFLPSAQDSLQEMEQRTWLAVGHRTSEQGVIEALDWREWQGLKTSLSQP